MRKPPPIAKIEKYVLFLERECGVPLLLPSEFESLKKRQTELRNIFAHGEWDMHYFIAHSAVALKALNDITPVLQAVERALTRGAAA